MMKPPRLPIDSNRSTARDEIGPANLEPYQPFASGQVCRVCHSSPLTACCKITAGCRPHERGVITMSLTLESRPCGSVLVVRCAGRIVSGEDSAILQATLQQALSEFTRVVLNVEAVSRVDSAGMGATATETSAWLARNPSSPAC